MNDEDMTLFVRRLAWELSTMPSRHDYQYCAYVLRYWHHAISRYAQTYELVLVSGQLVNNAPDGQYCRKFEGTSGSREGLNGLGNPQCESLAALLVSVLIL